VSFASGGIGRPRRRWWPAGRITPGFAAKCAGTAALLAGLAALLVSIAAGGSASAAAINADGSWSFPSEGALNPPSITVMNAPKPNSTAQPEYLFLAPIRNLAAGPNFIGKPGPEILAPNGTLVWEDPLGRQIKVGSATYKEVAMDFHTATYAGQPVIVWWQGYVTPNGFGTGTWEIANNHYHTIASIRAPTGWETDFHAFEITSNGMAYFLASKTVKLNLHCCSGPTDGTLYDQDVFEANIKTGHVVWSWDPLQHIKLRESYVRIPAHEPWDPYHVNSISLDSNGNVVISARDTWAAYWIERAGNKVGTVFATLGGKHSSFNLGKNVRFAWQHDVSELPGQQVSVFADEASPPESKQSRGVVIALDWGKHTANVAHEYFLPHPALAGSQGSVQILANGNVFVGWGQLPYFSEYSPSGKLLYLGALHAPDESYRTYKQTWEGLPQTKPSIAVVPGVTAGALDVGGSWNGATNVVSWQLLQGSSPSTLAPAGTPVPSQGFETAFAAEASQGPYYEVEALGKAGEVLGTSAPKSAPPAK
jgi:hypothetical protein